MSENTIETSAEDIKDQAGDVVDSVVNGAECCSLEKGKQLLQSNPVPAILGAFALGAIFVLLLPKPERSRRERYIDDPIDDLKDLLRSVSNQLGQSTGETLDTTSNALGCALKKLRTKFPF